MFFLFNCLLSETETIYQETNLFRTKLEIQYCLCAMKAACVAGGGAEGKFERTPFAPSRAQIPPACQPCCSEG